MNISEETREGKSSKLRKKKWRAWRKVLIYRAYPHEIDVQEVPFLILYLLMMMMMMMMMRRRRRRRRNEEERKHQDPGTPKRGATL